MGAQAGIAAYCAAAGDAVRAQQLARDLEVARLGWQAMTPAWFIAGALEDDDAEAGFSAHPLHIPPAG